MGPKGRDVNNPFEMLKNLGDMNDMKKILGDDFFKNMPFPQWQQLGMNDTEDPDTYPRMDVFERGSELVIVIEMAGVEKPTDISLSVGPHSLYIKGSVSALPVREEHVHLSERHHGPFEREIEFPVRVDESSVKAAYNSGLLTVRVSKYQATQGEGDQFIPISFE